MSKHNCSYVIIVPLNNIQKQLLLSIFVYAVLVTVLKYHVLAQMAFF